MSSSYSQPVPLGLVPHEQPLERLPVTGSRRREQALV
jgi:hypothetical protein